MNQEQAIAKMVAPGTPRPGKYRQGVIQIWVTRACDKACIGCTQGSNLRGNSGFISLQHFRQACESLADYFGVVGVFGGNPCLHPQFNELCGILQEVIPYERRGIWTNRLFGHGEICRETFNPAVSNVNVHMDQEAANEIRKHWPQVRIVGLDQDSHHSPPYVALQDLPIAEEDRWDLIADCDINKHWSAMIAPFRGELRAYFCEIAGAQSILHQEEPEYPDTGLAVVPGWWKQPMQEFAHQVSYHCHACGVPLRLRGDLSQDPNGIERVSQTHLPVYAPKRSGRHVQIIANLDNYTSLPRFIDYIKNAKK